MLYRVETDPWTDWLTIYPVDDTGFHIGKAYLERLPGNRVTPHFSVHPDAPKRTGIGSIMLDQLLTMTTDEVVWCDDPTYNGRGYFTTEGQRFADRYRTLRGIPLGTAPSLRPRG